MALDAARMCDRIISAIDAIEPYQGSDAAAMRTNRREVFLAMSDAICGEIKDNAVCETTSGAPDSEHTGKVY